MRLSSKLSAYLLLAALQILISCNGQESKHSKYDLSYQKNTDVCVLRLLNNKELCFKDGYDPAISPDGQRLAYTKSVNSGNDFIRYIVVVDLDSKIETKLNVNNSNYFGASWSPDNSYIAFSIYLNYNWQIGYIKSDNSELSIITANSDLGLFQPTWTSDSKYIVTHNMETVFRYDLKGNIVDAMDISRTFTDNSYMSSNSKFIFTSDDRFIIFNSGTDETMKDLEGPVEAIFAYDTKSKEIARLTPKGMFASDLNIESDQSIIFTGSTENENQNNIYRVDINSKKMELIIENGTRPTMSKK